MKYCFLYPGQGAQYPGMGKDLWESSATIKKLFKDASESTGIDLKSLLFEGSEEDLKATENTQVAVTLVNIASAIVLKERGIESSVCAGFSLGEVSALWDAGVISSKDLFPLVKERGIIMGKAGLAIESRGASSGMSAVIGLEYDTVAGLIQAEKLEEVYPANYNSPTQIVVSGTERGLNKADEAFKKAGARRVIRLKVSGPFHCPLMAEAETEYAKALEKYKFSDPVKPVYSNVTAAAVTTGAEAKKLCSRQLTSAVLWVKEEAALLDEGIDICLESGPGSVLSGLWKAVGGNLICRPAGKLEEIENINIKE